jgi:hypothetical protein
MRDHLFVGGPTGEDRERDCIRWLVLEAGGMPFSRWLSPLGWGLPMSWLAVSIPTDRLVSDSTKLPGDVDILGGPLSPEPGAWTAGMAKAQRELPLASPELHASLAWAYVNEVGGIEWPPRLEFIAAAEVRASWFTKDGALKATGLGAGDQRSYMAKATGLCRLGFDRVSLLRIVAGEPASGHGLNPWIEAVARADASARTLSIGLRITREDPYGSIILSVGALPGRDEVMSGSGSVEILNHGARNLLSKNAQAVRRRAEISAALQAAFQDVPAPSRRPAVLLACRSNECRKLFWAGQDLQTYCSDCGSASTFMSPRG